VLPGTDFLLVEWIAEGIGDPTAEAGIFVSHDPSAVYSGDPVTTATSSGTVLVDGLATGATYFVGLAVRVQAGEWVPSGSLLRARVIAPIYADPLADPGVADGQTIDTAFNDVFLAVVTAFSQGGGNVWIAEGHFDSVSFPLLADVSLYGGFAHGFVIDERDPAAHPTLLNGLAGPYVVRIDSGGDAQVVEGVVLDGLGSVTNGIDLSSTAIELRAVEVQGCTRGMRLRNNIAGPNVTVSITGSTMRANFLEGASLEGPFDLTVEHCQFVSNGAEGFDAGSLLALDGGGASISIRDSTLSGNGADGFDSHLVAPAAGGSQGGHFDILLEDCDFVGNAEVGAKVDIEYEAFPSWDSDISIRGCKSRANGLQGIHLDLDSSAEVFLNRLNCSANRSDGLLLTSESFVGMATVSASMFAANAGAGIRSTFGNFHVLASHCIFAGNFAAGLVSDHVSGAAISSIAYLQPAPWSGVLLRDSLAINLALPLAFDYPPTQFLRVTATSGPIVSVAPAPDFGSGTILELDDDESVRTATAVTASSVTVDPPPESASLLALAAFSGIDSVTEDWRLSDTSPAIGAGMSPPAGPLVDAGIFGSSSGGEPGAEELLPEPPFFATSLEPVWGAFQPAAAVSIGFEGGVPTLASLTTGVFVVDAQGQSVPISAFVQAGRLVIDAPAGGWKEGMWIELFPALRSGAGVSLSAPVAIPVLLP
jgi:hypothetical protein